MILILKGLFIIISIMLCLKLYDYKDYLDFMTSSEKTYYYTNAFFLACNMFIILFLELKNKPIVYLMMAYCAVHAIHTALAFANETYVDEVDLEGT